MFFLKKKKVKNMFLFSKNIFFTRQESQAYRFEHEAHDGLHS
jgi:hypothetical protein